MSKKTTITVQCPVHDCEGQVEVIFHSGPDDYEIFECSECGIEEWTRMAKETILERAYSNYNPGEYDGPKEHHSEL